MKPYRPDFMAYGPHITVSKDKALAFSEPEEIEVDDEDHTPIYKYYESPKILGKLFRAINEREIFSNVQRTGQPRGSETSVLLGIYDYLDMKADVLRLATPHMQRARGICDE